MNKCTERKGCVILGVVFFIFMKESRALECFHCGFSQQHYQKADEVELERQTYPIVDTNIYENVNEMPNGNEVPTKCRSLKCFGENSACLKWSFTSNHPINTTYTCAGNPHGRRGCFQLEIPDKGFLKVLVCLCDDKDNCNAAGRVIPFGTLLILAMTALFLAHSR